MPADELHGKVVQALMLADAEDWHDVGMVQPGRRAGLAAKPFQPRRVAEMVEGERLQGHVPAQRFLDRLVHHPHSARADGTEQKVIAQALRHRCARAGSGGLGLAFRPTPRAELFNDHQGGEQARIRSASSGCCAVYSVNDGRSPRRYRSRKASTSSSTGSNPDDGSFTASVLPVHRARVSAPV